MTTYVEELNLDGNAIPTSADYVGGAVAKWVHTQSIPDGLDVALGAKADAAVTNPATTASLIALIKGMLTVLQPGSVSSLHAEDAAAVSGDIGQLMLAIRRDTAVSDVSAAGDYSALHVDASGRLRIVDATTLVDPTNATTSALAASLVVKASAGKVWGITGYTTTDQFLQIHNATSLPSNGAVPAVVFPIEAGKPFSIAYTDKAREFSTGIVVCNSTTGPTKTIGGSDTWIDVQYE